MSCRPGIAMAIALIGLLCAGPARAQQIDTHFSYIPGDEGTHYPLVGAGVGVRKMFDVRSLFLGARLGADYAREEHLGPGRGTAGLDLTISPHGETPAIVPYAGVGVSMNWSGGAQRAWSGIRGGVDGLVGADIAMFGTNFVGLKIEERYGKIDRLRPEFATRLGIIFGF